VVLHPQLLDAQLLGQVPRPQQRSEAHRLADVGLTFRDVQRQERRVAPDAGRPRLDLCAADLRGDDLVVVVDLEGAEAELADVNIPIVNGTSRPGRAMPYDRPP